MSEIVQHDYNGFLISQRKSDGYTCLTDMAKATNRKVAKYFELKSTEAYLEGLSADVQIRISELVEISKGGNKVNDQGTWAHPEIAIDFARWCSVPFRIWANRALRLLIESKEIHVEVEPAPLTLPPAEKAKLAIEIVRDAFADLEFGNNPQQSNSLKAGILLSTAQEACPELASSLLPAQKFLAATNTVDAEDVVWLTPTSLGKYLGLSAVKVNRQLRDMGLQIQNHNSAKGEPDWLPTERGEEYSRMTAATGGNGDMTTYQHLKWSKRVLEVFDGGVAA
ncbi:KilA-N domain-containing protein [Leptolyngbyaceae cyanobacterium CCMR0082]|uniref:KilA-N domain-containing protein n=1 Tax=Adonisia turfae CCMR0082 TaxID=2304604 RepID=A0A6M0SG84_9CYAN|nr:KilA-N domain-containing protein [Adonisia turfae]NEZ66632.1 KilA-N domain-containing protein [Adonisia turfae CCMR0082]